MPGRCGDVKGLRAAPEDDILRLGGVLVGGRRGRRALRVLLWLSLMAELEGEGILAWAHSQEAIIIEDGARWMEKDERLSAHVPC